MRRRSCPVPSTARRPWSARLTSALTPARRYLSEQARRPHGPVGLLLSQIWIRETAAVNDTAIELLAPIAGERILELGFGPGRTHLAVPLAIQRNNDQADVDARRDLSTHVVLT